MADVRQIYMTIASYRDVGVLVMLILFLFAAVIHFRKASQYLSQGYLSGSFVFLLIFGFVGTWAALDFSNFWTFFHEMLFWNDLWLFDSTTSRMINMLPEQIFADIIARVGAYAGAVILALIALSILALVLVLGRVQTPQSDCARAKESAGRRGFFPQKSARRRQAHAGRGKAAQRKTRADRRGKSPQKSGGGSRRGGSGAGASARGKAREKTRRRRSCRSAGTTGAAAECAHGTRTEAGRARIFAGETRTAAAAAAENRGKTAEEKCKRPRRYGISGRLTGTPETGFDRLGLIK